MLACVNAGGIDPPVIVLGQNLSLSTYLSGTPLGLRGRWQHRSGQEYWGLDRGDFHRLQTIGGKKLKAD